MQTPTSHYTYDSFLDWCKKLLLAPPIYDEKYNVYIPLNIKRMERINKTVEIEDADKTFYAQIAKPQKWVVITEPWCGDSAQNLPILAKIVEESKSKIDLQIILRDENPEWIDRFLTNGSKAIPKLIAMDDNNQVLFTWGPRPDAAQIISDKWKENKETISWEDFEKEMHTWYAHNKGVDTLSEIKSLIDNADNDKENI